MDPPAGPAPAADARILRWYAAELATPREGWFVATAARGRRPGDLLARERLDDFVAGEAPPAAGRVPAGG